MNLAGNDFKVLQNSLHIISYKGFLGQSDHCSLLVQGCKIGVVKYQQLLQLCCYPTCFSNIIGSHHDTMAYLFLIYFFNVYFKILVFITPQNVSLSFITLLCSIIFFWFLQIIRTDESSNWTRHSDFHPNFRIRLMGGEIIFLLFIDG